MDKCATDVVLWNLDETARQLGGVSTRTVRRLIDNRELAVVRIGRAVRVEVASVQAYVERSMRPAHNLECVGPGMRSKENNACRTNAKIVKFGGFHSSIQAAKELDALLERKTEKRRMP